MGAYAVSGHAGGVLYGNNWTAKLYASSPIFINRRTILVKIFKKIHKLLTKICQSVFGKDDVLRLADRKT